MTEDLIRVMLVDDEPLVRDLLKRCIDWSRLGMTIVGEAVSAPEALDLVEQLKPEIIFTDICMPFMDGIEFSKIILGRNPWIKMVIITGYEDFEYVQRSIKAGVADFILKPINDEEITKVALAMKAKIEAEKARNEEYNRLKQHLDENLPFLRERFLNNLLVNNIETADIKNKMEYYRIAVKSELFQVAVIEIINVNRELNEESWLLLRMHGLDITRQILQGFENINVFFDNSQRIVVLSNDDTADLTMVHEKIKMHLLSELHCPICIGVGNAHQKFNIRASYKEACNALQYRVIVGNNEIIHYRDIDFSIVDKWSFQNDQVDMFYFYLKAGMKQQALELLEIVFSELIASHGITVDRIRVVGSNIISTVLNTLTDLDLNTVDVFGKVMHPYDQVFKIDSLPEMKQYIKGITINTLVLVNNLHHRKVSQVIREIQDFLINNYSNNELSLVNVAHSFYLNPSYLSRIFKQETNQTFIEYLTQIRMEKAIKMFKETDLKAYQVADKVGISDPHYFGLCFKKYTGMPLNDYKKSQTL